MSCILADVLIEDPRDGGNRPGAWPTQQGADVRKFTGTIADYIDQYTDSSGGPDACWPWTGPTMNMGYGMIAVRHFGRPLAHRAQCERFNGVIPEDWQVDHLCHDPATCQETKKCPHRLCVNPKHLEATTALENNLRSGSICAQNARATVCSKGHSLGSDGDVRLNANGSRSCRECCRQYDRQRRGPGMRPSRAKKAAA